MAIKKSSLKKRHGATGFDDSAGFGQK